MAISLAELWKSGRCLKSPHYVEGHKADSAHWQRINASARIGRAKVSSDVARWLRSLPATPAPAFRFTAVSEEAHAKVIEELARYGMTDAHTPEAPKAKSEPQARSSSAREADALRRAYRDWITGRAFMDRAGRNYRVRDSRTGRSRVAPWNALVKARFPNSMDFHNAAFDWRRARAQRKAA